MIAKSLTVFPEILQGNRPLQQSWKILQNNHRNSTKDILCCVSEFSLRTVAIYQLLQIRKSVLQS